MGLTANSFRTRYSNHKASFTNFTQKAQHQSKQILYNISGIWKKSSFIQPHLKQVLLMYLGEALYDLHAVFASLNKRNELISWCRHAGKNSLKNFGRWYFFSYLLMSCHNHSHFQRWRIYCEWPCAQFKSACHVHLHLAILSDECNTSCVVRN